MAEMREALDVLDWGAELGLRRRCVVHAVHRAAVRGRHQRIAAGGDRDNLFFGHGCEQRQLAILQLIDPPLRSGRQKNAAIGSGADRVDDLLVELADDLHESIAVDLVQLTAAAALRLRRGLIFE